MCLGSYENRGILGPSKYIVLNEFGTLGKLQGAQRFMCRAARKYFKLYRQMSQTKCKKIMNFELRQFDFKTDHVDGLTFAIIVVFEFPPKESCIQRCRYNHLTFTYQSRRLEHIKLGRILVREFYFSNLK